MRTRFLSVPRLRNLPTSQPFQSNRLRRRMSRITPGYTPLRRAISAAWSTVFLICSGVVADVVEPTLAVEVRHDVQAHTIRLEHGEPWPVPVPEMTDAIGCVFTPVVIELRAVLSRPRQRLRIRLFATRAEILAFTGATHGLVQCREWGLGRSVRALTVQERRGVIDRNGEPDALTFASRDGE